MKDATIYSVRYTHATDYPLSTEAGPDVAFEPLPLESRREMGRILRKSRIIGSGARVTRVVVDGVRIVVHHRTPRTDSTYPTVILTPVHRHRGAIVCCYFEHRKSVLSCPGCCAERTE